MGLAVYIFHGEFKGSPDERFVEVCKNLRKRLYGYLGAVGAYLVFMLIVRPAG